MTSPLIDKLSTDHGYPILTAENFDVFVAQHRQVVLFFSQNAMQFPECNDVAVILPELLKVFADQLQAAVIDASIARELQARYRFASWPSLVFLEYGEYLGVISGILDWHDYVAEIKQILASQPGLPPAFDLDKVCTALH